MFEAVAALLSKQLKISKEEIRPESLIKDDLGADSLDILQLLMTIEEEYGIVIPDEKLAKFETVRDVVSYLEKRQG